MLSIACLNSLWPAFRMRMAMKVKPKEIKDGLLVYCAQTEDGAGDFSSLAIKNKRVEFRFDSGSGKRNMSQSLYFRG